VKRSLIGKSNGELDITVDNNKDRVQSVYTMMQDVRGIIQKDKFRKLEGIDCLTFLTF
jgi:hypothetical protein